MPFGVWLLRWCDVDPQTHAFNPARVAATLERVITESPRLDRERGELEQHVDRALIAEFGHWVAGWRWNPSEPGCGGPVPGYCCDAHSLRGSPEDMRQVVGTAVRNWRARLEELDALYADLRREASGLEADVAATRAATRLLPLVLEWTHVEDAWYATFHQVLTWYLQMLLGDSDRIFSLVDGAMGGRFESWLEPPSDIAAAVCADIGNAIQREFSEGPPTVDHLHLWIGVREKTRWAEQRRYSPEPAADGHRRFITNFDAQRSPERAERLGRALDAARSAARHSSVLSFELLRDWQALVLGESVDFRTRDARAHGGAERYALDTRTQRRFERCLAQTTDDSLTPIARAARVYLDICFFHPFPDGNARSARLALDFVLTSHGLALHSAEPVFLAARRASDPYGPGMMQFVVDYLAGPSFSE
ncbi:MAG: Fic family protein [Polyangiaceae bacterium]